MSRLRYLNDFLEQAEKKKLNPACQKLLEKNIEFIKDFMNGEFSKEIDVPKKYFEDKSDCLIVPTETELEYLFNIIKSNKTMFEMLYQNNKFKIDLPKNTFNQNMTRILEIKKHNLAHLLGFTDSEPTPDPNKNQLKKYFLSHVENTEQYGETIAERLLNWILSEEGQDEIRRLNRITLEYINEDKKKNKNCYDEEGKIKLKALDKFKERFKKDTGFDYPIIKFSRYISKCINTINFFNMSNIYQMILDYNAPPGKDDEKDIFIVNCSKKIINKEIEAYIKFEKIVIELLEAYAESKDELKKQEIKTKLKSILGIDLNEGVFGSFINLVESNLLKEESCIAPDLSVLKQKVRNSLMNLYDNNIHLLGFDTDFNGLITDINEKTTNTTHCDTSISITLPELVGEFYERGRPFFLDKIEEANGYGVLRISAPLEEIRHLRQMELLGLMPNSRRKALEKEFMIFTNNIRKFQSSTTDEKEKVDLYNDIIEKDEKLYNLNKYIRKHEKLKKILNKNYQGSGESSQSPDEKEEPHRTR